MVEQSAANSGADDGQQLGPPGGDRGGPARPPALAIGTAVNGSEARQIARGGRQVILERGDYERSIVARFPSLEQAVACYNSPEYTHARSFAEGAGERHMVAVEGLD